MNQYAAIAERLNSTEFNFNHDPTIKKEESTIEVGGQLMITNGSKDEDVNAPTEAPPTLLSFADFLIMRNGYLFVIAL